MSLPCCSCRVDVSGKPVDDGSRDIDISNGEVSS